MSCSPCPHPSDQSDSRQRVPQDRTGPQDDEQPSIKPTGSISLGSQELENFLVGYIKEPVGISFAAGGLSTVAHQTGYLSSSLRLGKPLFCPIDSNRQQSESDEVQHLPRMLGFRVYGV